ncbi:MAG: vitamin B12 dependent-methionine synthase activation domain-containing protein [Clostridium sp.]
MCEGLKRVRRKGCICGQGSVPDTGIFFKLQNCFDALDAGKHLGIKLTDSFLMMPSKSVTAVIGVSQKPHRCDVKGCEACGKTDCLYRR